MSVVSNPSSPRGLPAASVFALVLLAVATGCRTYHRCDGARYGAGNNLDVELQGQGVFLTFDTPASWDDKQHARVQLRGSFAPKSTTPVPVRVTKAVVMGDPEGSHIGDACDVMLSVAWPKSPWRLSWIDSDWNGGTRYDVLVRYFYELDYAGTTWKLFQDVRGSFESIAPSLSKHWTGVTINGDAITGAYASGSFSSTQGIALYDVRVEYNQSTAQMAETIEVFAAPKNTTGFPQPRHRIFAEVAPVAAPGAVVWERNGIPGSYTATANDYELSVRVNYSDGSASIRTGSFLNIAATGNAMTLIPQ